MVKVIYSWLGYYSWLYAIILGFLPLFLRNLSYSRCMPTAVNPGLNLPSFFAFSPVGGATSPVVRHLSGIFLLCRFTRAVVSPPLFTFLSVSSPYQGPNVQGLRPRVAISSAVCLDLAYPHAVRGCRSFVVVSDLTQVLSLLCTCVSIYVASCYPYQRRYQRQCLR